MEFSFQNQRKLSQQQDLNNNNEIVESLLQDGLNCLINLKNSFNEIKDMLKKFSEHTKDYQKKISKIYSKSQDNKNPLCLVGENMNIFFQNFSNSFNILQTTVYAQYEKLNEEQKIIEITQKEINSIMQQSSKIYNNSKQEYEKQRLKSINFKQEVKNQFEGEIFQMHEEQMNKQKQQYKQKSEELFQHLNFQLKLTEDKMKYSVMQCGQQFHECFLEIIKSINQHLKQQNLGNNQIDVNKKSRSQSISNSSLNSIKSNNKNENQIITQKNSIKQNFNITQDDAKKASIENLIKSKEIKYNDNNKISQIYGNNNKISQIYGNFQQDVHRQKTIEIGALTSKMPQFSNIISQNVQIDQVKKNNFQQSQIQFDKNCIVSDLFDKFFADNMKKSILN